MPQILPLVWNDFSGGWRPSNDAKNGAKNSLLQMDNVELDRNGALTLIGGTEVVRSYGNSRAHTLFSRVMKGIRNDYIAMENGDTWRNEQKLAAGGDPANAAFGTAFNYTLITNGRDRLKDTGEGIVVYNLGIEIPSVAPIFWESDQLFTQPFTISEGTLSALSGTLRVDDGGILRLRADQETGVGSVIYSNLFAAPSFDWSVFPDGTILTDNDELVFAIGSFLKGIDSITLDIALVEPVDGVISEAFTFTPELSDFIPIDAEADTYGGYFVKIKRSQFLRRGEGPQGWSTVVGFKITYTTPFFGDEDKGLELALGNGDTLNFVGGSGAQDGIYQWAIMYVRNDGSYLGKSELSPLSKPITANLAQTKIKFTKPLDPQVNEIWLFRRAVDGNGLLDQWYLTQKILKPAWDVPVLDNLGDQEALTLGITVNLNLISIAFGRSPERFIDIVGPIEGRWLYFTDSFMYPSDINNPDLIDVSKGVRTVAGVGEKFLWARALSDSLVLVATSVDFYIMSGTFQTLPDESIDIYYKPTHSKYPAISFNVVLFNSTAFYMANDGWRSFSVGGGNPSITAPSTDRLYRNIACYGYDPPNVKVLPGSVRFPITITENRLICFITGTDRYEVYDYTRNYWRPVRNGLEEVTAVTTTQDGRTLAFHADGKLRFLETQTTKLIDGATPQTVTILTQINDGERPHNRKDAFTFTGRIYTGPLAGGLGLLVKVINDPGEIDTNGEVIYQNNPPEFALAVDNFIDLIDRVPPSKTFQLLISGQVTNLNITDLTIDTGLRPQQLTSYRFLNSNFGNACKKRLRVWPLVIDTLGNDVLFTPFGDGSEIPAEEKTINTPAGARPGGISHRVHFTTDIFNVDYGFILKSQSLDSHGNELPFELYDPLTPVFVQILPIAKRFDQVGPDELFKYGKIKQFEIRILPDSGAVGGVAPLPIRIFFNDNHEYEQNITVWNAIEASYFVGVPKGTSGEIVRIEIGPTCYDFHRWYIRIQVARGGADTELQWITLPSPESANGF